MGTPRALRGIGGGPEQGNVAFLKFLVRYQLDTESSASCPGIRPSREGTGAASDSSPGIPELLPISGERGYSWGYSCAKNPGCFSVVPQNQLQKELLEFGSSQRGFWDLGCGEQTVLLHPWICWDVFGEVSVVDSRSVFEKREPEPGSSWGWERSKQ